jgi:hypothetical protein
VYDSLSAISCKSPTELAPVAAGAGSFFMLVFYAGNVGAFLSRPLVRG